MKKFFLLLLACAACTNNPNQIKVAATSVPHAEMLKAIQPQLEKEGVYLKILEIDDYTAPNRLLIEHQVDANFFQHQPYLDQQKEQHGYRIKTLTAVHIEPLGIYSLRIKTLQDLPNRGKVAIPNDPTNEARALYLLEKQNLIKLKSVKLPTIHDIISNPKNLRFEELDAPFLPRALKDVDIAVIPSNFALLAGYSPPEDAIAQEGPDSPYANVVAVRENEQREALDKLRKALNSNEMRDFIEKKYHGALVPAF
ncbi:MAG: MetQ/NlpA family ABC transporter substrate-binding protein [Chlamydiales bacterium]